VLLTVLGGRGSISGVVMAAILLTILPEALREFDQYRLIAYALLLIFMMLLRPQGLFGIHEIWDIRPKFSLKNLLIAVTIIALLLGLYVYSQFR
jgi:branched-chain amino acid transport system permease protein